MTEFVTDNDDTQLETGSQLRARLEAEIKARKAAEELVAALRSEKAQDAVAKTWDDLKVPEKFRKAYLGEKEPDAIKEWWEGLSPWVNLDGPNDAGVKQEETEEQAGQRATIQATQRASTMGQEFDSTVDEGLAKAQSLRATNRPINQADLDEVFNKLGVRKDAPM